ncbi:MAG: hypothetical protein EOO68_16975, partial [Moraxellaceae bacterium]
MLSKLITGGILSSFFVSTFAFAQTVVDTSVRFPSNAAETQLNVDGTPQNWLISSTPPKFTLISIGDINVPIKISTGEFIISDAQAGIFKFYDGKVSSVTPTTVNTVTRKPNCYTNMCNPLADAQAPKYRPTLFVSIKGFSLNSGVEDWQTEILDPKLIMLADKLHYKHFALDWDASRQILSQAIDMADYLSVFLANQDYAWNVVLIGHSRGGIFAHELSKLLAGNNKIKNLHAILLDPTTAPMFGDIYPTQKPSDVSGYLKYDGRSFVGITFGTVSDRQISGYNNYGQNNFLTNFRSNESDEISHNNYAQDWVNNSFTQLLPNILHTNDMGSFKEKVSTGYETITLRTEDIENTLSTICNSDETSCTLNGQITLGQGTTVSISNMVSKNGLDASIATAAGSATAIIRRDQIRVEQSTLIDSQSIIVNNAGISSSFNVGYGNDGVQARIGKDGGSISITIGGKNIPLESLGPLE